MFHVLGYDRIKVWPVPMELCISFVHFIFVVDLSYAVYDIACVANGSWPSMVESLKSYLENDEWNESYHS